MNKVVTDAVAPQVEPSKWSARKLLLRLVRDYAIVLAFVALVIVLAIASPAFATRTNVFNILDQIAPIGIIAVAGTLVVIAGGFDLSVGSIYALAGVVAALVTNKISPELGIIAALAVGAGLGFFNGVVINVLRVNSFIATLATSYVFRGLAILITGGYLIVVKNPRFKMLGRWEFLSVRYSAFALLVVALFGGFLLSRTTFGRHCYAAGGNEVAARLSGVQVGRVRTLTFVFSGMCAALAGVIGASRIATAQANTGLDLALGAIAAIVIGGTSIWGGSGAVWRSILGVLLLALIGNGFNILNIDPFYQSIVQGIIIIVAVAADALTKRRR